MKIITIAFSSKTGKPIKNFVKRINKKNIKRFVHMAVIALDLKLSTNVNLYLPLVLVNSTKTVTEQIIKQDSNSVNTTSNSILLIRGGDHQSGRNAMGKALSKLASSNKTPKNNSSAILARDSNSININKPNGVFSSSRNHTPSSGELPIPPKPRLNPVRKSNKFSSTKSSSVKLKKTEETNIDSVSKPVTSDPMVNDQDKTSKSSNQNEATNDQKQKPSPTKDKVNSESQTSFKADNNKPKDNVETSNTIFKIEELKRTSKLMDIGIVDINIIDKSQGGLAKIKNIEFTTSETGQKELSADSIEFCGYQTGKLKVKLGSTDPDKNSKWIKGGTKVTGDIVIVKKLAELDKKLITKAAACIGNTEQDSFIGNFTDVIKEGCDRAGYDSRYVRPCLGAIVAGPGHLGAFNLGYLASSPAGRMAQLPAAGLTTISVASHTIGVASVHNTARFLIADHNHTADVINSTPIQQNLENLD